MRLHADRFARRKLNILTLMSDHEAGPFLKRIRGGIAADIDFQDLAANGQCEPESLKSVRDAGLET